MSRQVLTLPDVPPTLLTQSAADLKYLPLTGGQLTGNLGVGVAPAAWRSDLHALQLADAGAVFGVTGGSNVWLASNTVVDSGGHKAIRAEAGAYLLLAGGILQYQTAPAVAAGAAQTFATRLAMDANGTTTFSPATGFPAISTNSNLSVGTQMSAWDSGYRVIQFPNMAIYTLASSANTLEMGVNSYVNGGVRKAIVGTISGSVLQFSNNEMLFYQMAQVAQDATQTASLRFRITSIGELLHQLPTGGTFLVGSGNTGNVRLQNINSGFNMEMAASGGYWHPSTDNTLRLGAASLRFIEVCSVAGTLNTSSRDLKEIVGTVNDTVALEQLMSLPAIYRFHYKHNVPDPDDPDNPEKMTVVTDTSKEFLGPVAEEMPMDMKLSEVEVGNINTEGHLMASLRGAVVEYRTRLTHLEQRIAAVEGRLPA